MKNLYLIGGTMGVGKTTVSRLLQFRLRGSVFLDGDWCWDARPFVVTEETKAMVLGNICFLLGRFLNCSAYENVIFCWVMHEQGIIDHILENTARPNCNVRSVSLLCNEQTLRERLSEDIRNGIRKEDVILRSVARIPLYDKLDTVKIVTDGKTPENVADEIAAL